MSDSTKREISYLEAVREALVQEMRRDSSVFLMGEDIGVYGGAFGVTQGLLQQFGPERVIAIAEQNRGLSSAEIVQRIKDSVIEFSQGQPQFDDITLMVLKTK